MLSTVLLDLTFRDVIAGIPRDAGAVVAYLLLGIFVALIWLGSRSKQGVGAEVEAGSQAAESKRSGSKEDPA